MVTRKGSEVTRWNVNPIPLLALVVSTIVLILALGTMVWNLSNRLATSDARVTALELENVALRTNVSDTMAYYTNIKKWQDGYDAQQALLEKQKLDKLLQEKRR